MFEETARRINLGYILEYVLFPELLVIILPDFISSFCSKHLRLMRHFLSIKEAMGEGEDSFTFKNRTDEL